MRDGVVLLHGIGVTARVFGKMQRALEAAGYATLNLNYASRRKALEALAEDIHPAVDLFADGLGGSVHFVCHSMGGLLAIAFLRDGKFKSQLSSHAKAGDSVNRGVRD